jgi:hypothetical protein
MSRWVDAEYCEDFFDRWESRVKNAEPVTIDVVQNTRTLLRDAPSIDIVRCGECEKWLDGSGLCKHWSKLYGGVLTKADDFCSYGEREGEQTLQMVGKVKVEL